MTGCGVFARLARQTAMQELGRVSYSLYLWQQMFLARADYYLTASLLSFAPLMLPVAWISYHLIEKSGLRIGHAISQLLAGHRAYAPARAG